MDYSATGNQGLIDNFKSWVQETDPATLKALMAEYLERCQFQVLNFTEHYFSPHGYTCLWLLGESHLAIHTFPEKGLCYIELSSCNAKKNEQFQSLLESRFSHPAASSKDVY
ncbi:S-adenosylmethionine decarboxylase family protein [Nafulsella turpanensis]|uniref:S-adenosylmethionine decarboxylase family protein n=1 Tax=Nafulsella turpanensis TaxID=1265690 RepID=UPI000347AF37|nr:S-adenosylmethionine decarboxylase [Nafulsella turpanensis]